MLTEEEKQSLQVYAEYIWEKDERTKDLTKSDWVFELRDLDNNELRASCIATTSLDIEFGITAYSESREDLNNTIMVIIPSLLKLI